MSTRALPTPRSEKPENVPYLSPDLWEKVCARVRGFSDTDRIKTLDALLKLDKTARAASLKAIAEVRRMFEIQSKLVLEASEADQYIEYIEMQGPFPEEPFDVCYDPTPPELPRLFGISSDSTMLCGCRPFGCVHFHDEYTRYKCISRNEAEEFECPWVHLFSAAVASALRSPQE